MWNKFAKHKFASHFFAFYVNPNTMNITNDIKYVGVNDKKIDFFESQYLVPEGVTYNSYVIMDEKIAIMDTVDIGFTDEWLDNLKSVLGDREPDYLIVQHMEPDHSANIMSLVNRYPNIKIVSSSAAFVMMKNFFGTDFEECRVIVGEGDSISLGKHTLRFVTAPMVHWPEVIMTYETTEKVLFSADAFGTFGVIDSESKLLGESWADEARRYYIGVVGKYGAQVQNLLKKISSLDIQVVCPLHGPVLKGDLSYYINLYDKWSSYTPEVDGVLIVYTSVYGNTKRAALELEKKLLAKNIITVKVHDLARCDMSSAVQDAFKYKKIVFATTTYNGELFPHMREFIAHITERNFSNRVVAFIENGSWAPTATKVMKSKLENCKNLIYAQPEITINSALSDENLTELDELAGKLC